MANITREIEILLDRVFNLKGPDNTKIKGLESDIEQTQKEIKDNDELLENLKIKKLNLKTQLEQFSIKSSTIEDLFKGYDDDTFAELRAIGVDIKIGTWQKAIDEKGPEYKEQKSNDIQSTDNEINEKKQNGESLSQRLSELKAKKAKEEDNRDKLASLIEQCLSSDVEERESLTINFIKRILNSFEEFSPGEVSLIAKQIIFPDDILVDYASTYEERLNTGLTMSADKPEEETQILDTVAVDEEEPVVDEDHSNEQIELNADTSPIYEMPDNESPKVDNPQEEQSVEQEDIQSLDGDTTIIDLSTLNQHTEPEEPVLISPEEEKAPETEEQPAEENKELVEGAVIPEAKLTEQPHLGEDKTEQERKKVIKYLKNAGLDIEKFKDSEINDVDFNTILDSLVETEEKTIIDNYELLRSLNVNPVLPYQYRLNHIYIGDNELIKKVTLLRAKGINDNIIKQLLEKPDSGLKENYETISSRIDAIEALEQRVDEENITQIAINMVEYQQNIAYLKECGFDLDATEIRNHAEILTEIPDFQERVGILKNYLMSIMKRNGKYALETLLCSPKELIEKIDELIEAGLEDLITSSPDVLSLSSSEVIKRVNFLKAHDIPISDGNSERPKFNSYIADFKAFYDKYGNDIPAITETNNNVNLPEIIGNNDYTEILVDALDSYYRSTDEFTEPELSGDDLDKFNLLKQQAVDVLKAKPTGTYTYKIGDICISKYKLERNMKIIISVLSTSSQTIEGTEREIILTSALYNLKANEKDVRKVVEECLGFNETPSPGVIGGMKK